MEENHSKIGNKTGGPQAITLVCLMRHRLMMQGLTTNISSLMSKGLHEMNHSEFSLYTPNVFYQTLVEQRSKTNKTLVTVSSLSDILQSTFERPNQWAPDAIRINVYIVVHHKYSDLCLQKEQCIKESQKFNSLV